MLTISSLSYFSYSAFSILRDYTFYCLTFESWSFYSSSLLAIHNLAWALSSFYFSCSIFVCRLNNATSFSSSVILIFSISFRLKVDWSHIMWPRVKIAKKIEESDQVICNIDDLTKQRASFSFINYSFLL